MKIWYPTQANEVFASFPDGVAEALRAEGAAFYPWITPGDPADGRMHRLICSFATKDAEVDAFLARAATLAAERPAARPVARPVARPAARHG